MQLALSSEQAKESSIVARTGTVDLVDLHWVGRALDCPSGARYNQRREFS